MATYGPYEGSFSSSQYFTYRIYCDYNGGVTATFKFAIYYTGGGDHFTFNHSITDWSLTVNGTTYGVSDFWDPAYLDYNPGSSQSNPIYLVPNTQLYLLHSGSVAEASVSVGGANVLNFSSSVNVGGAAGSGSASGSIVLQYNTVTFNANGGSGTMPTQTFTTISGIEQINLNAFTPPAGYTKFQYWTTNSDGTGDIIGDNQYVSTAQNYILYAHWGNNNVVVFDGRGATGTMSPQILPNPGESGYAKRVVLNVNTYTNSGYYFYSWNTMHDGSGRCYPDQSFIRTDASITLYAQWIGGSDTYAIAYDFNDNNDSNTAFWNRSLNNEYVTHTDQYLGWFGYEGGEVYPYFYVYNPTLIGIYSPPSTAYDYGYLSNPSNYLDSRFTSTIDSYLVDTGKGAYDSTYGKYLPYYSGDSQFHPIVYAGGNPYLSYVGRVIGTTVVAQASRNNYNFAGWHISNMTASMHWSGSYDTSTDAKGDYQDAFLRNSAGTVIFTARWSPKLTYDANYTGGGTTTDYVDYYDGTTSLSGSTFTPPTGKQFVEWNTQANGQGTSYAAGVALQSSNPSGSNYIEEPTTLYAIWESPHPDWYWYSQAQDPTKILVGEPTTNAPASRFYNGTTGLQDDIKQYVNPSYVPITTLVSGSAMKASDFNHASSELGMSAVTAGTVIQAQKFIDIRDALNNHFNS